MLTYLYIKDKEKEMNITDLSLLQSQYISQYDLSFEKNKLYENENKGGGIVPITGTGKGTGTGVVTTHIQNSIPNEVLDKTYFYDKVFEMFDKFTKSQGGGSTTLDPHNPKELFNYIVKCLKNFNLLLKHKKEENKQILRLSINK